MKTLIAISLLFLSGCVSVKYNPETKEVSYLRVGDQKLSGVVVEIGDTSILIEQQHSEAKLLQDAISLFKAGLEAGRGE